MAETADNAKKVTPPDGFFPAKVDSAGRIKLPADFQRFLAGLPDKELFATSTENGIAKIYINGSWTRTKEKIFAAKEHQSTAMSYFRVAAKLGGNVELDSNGRVTLPQELRRKMSWQDTPVQLLLFKELIQIYPADYLERQVAVDQAVLDENRDKVEALDLL
jgi:DNA-binding transcriptional regulator/RsmH inhibitor MraZ